MPKRKKESTLPSVYSKDHGNGFDHGYEGPMHPCCGCVHWRGESYGSLCCNYIFDMNRRRPCPPGEGCTEKRTKGMQELAFIHKLKKMR